jgi:hypothetical protein
MTIKKILIAILRLLWSPFVGAWEACKEDLNRPVPKDWKEDLRLTFKSYFSPLTGAIAGIKKEIRRIRNC